ncbi:MAG: ROK family protein [Methylacidiphilales bacterium]|nr:ROK family protein [Candidatus Methylacidiphilales bacterium]
MNAPVYLGWDVGGTKCSALVGTRAGETISRLEWLSESALGPEPMIHRFLDEARKLVRDRSVAGVGVSIGGPLNSRAGIIYSPPHLPGWDAVPLKEILERELRLPVNIEHDAAACAFAEYLWGAGRGAQNLAYLTCGTGFGAGFVFGGKIHRGAHGASCEAGHITLRNEGPVFFGKQGSAEAWCSGTALTLLAAWKFPERWGKSPPGGPELGRLAEQGDADAGEIIRLNAAAVGEVCALLTDTLGLDRILLGSLARYLGRPWLDEVRRSFERHVLPALGESCRIEAAGLGDRLQDCSALAAALAGESLVRDQ